MQLRQYTHMKSHRTLPTGEAVEAKLVENETSGYFLARIFHHLVKIGVDKDKVRFRQHVENEMAHYACDL